MVYQPKPCRRCGGEKEPRKALRNMWFCNSCAIKAQRDWWRRNFPWWCGCDSPHFCVTCERTKKDRFREAMRLRSEKRASSPSGYFRPLNAERFWQQRSHSLIQQAVKRGLLPDLKPGEYACVDCGDVAHEYDHRDYGRPFDVEPVCRSCNKQRGTAIWPTPDRFDFKKLPSAASDQAAA